VYPIWLNSLPSPFTSCSHRWECPSVDFPALRRKLSFF
jgi:hypothetical protein